MKAQTMKGIFICMLILVSFILISATSTIAEDKNPSFTLSASFQDNLLMSKGQYAYIALKSGATYAGFIRDVKNNLLHLGNIEHRDYFDALIRVEDIAAFEIQFRGLN